MKKALKKILFIIIGNLLLFPLSLLNAGEYLWPIEGYYTLTGTFGEFRYSHFHAGIDISTKGIIGLPIKAIENGYVYRIRTSPVGYGRALYLMLDDGNIAVYGHLSKFAPKIEKWVQQKQLETREFSLNTFFDPYFFPIKKGEVIGYSGDTGNVPPHLHFELRKEEDQPVNPLIYIPKLPLEQAYPRINAVAINPMGIDSTVDEDWETKIYRARWDSHRRCYYIPENIYVWGKCGIEVFTYDILQRHRLGINKIQMFVNDELVSTLKYDSFFYREYRKNYQLVDRELFLKEKGRFQRLYRTPGNNLSFYFITEGRDGTLSTSSSFPCTRLQPGKNQLKITVENSGKKKQSLLFYLIAQPPFFQQKESIRYPIKKISNFNLENLKVKSELRFYEDFLIIKVFTNKTPPLPPQGYIQQAKGEEKKIFLYPRSLNNYVGRCTISPYLDGKAQIKIVFSPPSGGRKEKIHTFTVQTLSPEKGGTIVSDDGIIRITVSPGGINELIFPRVEKIAIDPHPDFLVPLSLAYQFEPLDVIFNSPAKITFRYPESTPEPYQLAIFYWDKGKNWHFLSSKNESEKKTITAQIPFFARFALMRDAIPPIIHPYSPRPGTCIQSGDIKFSVQVTDRGSGINYKKTTMLIDGEKVPAEYIPKKNLLLFDPPKPLEEGAHSLKIIASDLVGNTSKVEVRFKVESD